MNTPPRILIVDDEPFNVDYLEQELEESGYELLTASNGQEALDQIRNASPDLVLLDIMMPVMDGLEATKLIREVGSLKHTPIVALTALAMPGDRERCIAAGMTDYLSKPIRIQELADMIQKHLISKGQKPNDQ